MTTHTDSFTSALSPEEVLDRFARLSEEKAWKIQDRDEHVVDAKKGVSFKTWGEHIEVTANDTPDGTQVHLAVHAPQLVDWGEGSDTQSEVKARLGG